MEEIINLIFNNGIGVVCVGFMIFFQNTTMKDLVQTIQTMNQSLILMNERLDKIENKLNERE